MILSYFSVFIVDYSVSIVLILAYSFIEGQLRVVWGYGNFFRVSFDLMIILLYVKYALNEKKIVSLSKIPTSFVMGFSTFMLYYVLSIFNPNGAGLVPGLVVAKMYVLPFLFLFLLIDVTFTKDAVSLFKKLLFPVAFLFGVLTLYHKVVGEDFLYGISTNYKNLFPAFEVFTGALFRPWSTSLAPGAASIIYLYNYLIFFIPFLLPHTLWFSIIKFIFTIIGILGAVVCNVRTALLQLIFYTVVILIGMAYKGTARFRRFVLFIFLIGFGGIGMLFSGMNLDRLSTDYNLDESIKRLEELNSSKKGEKKEFRAGPDVILQKMKDQVQWPFGYGPGMTTTVIPDFAEARARFKSYDYWTFDNFYYQMFQEFGVGALLVIGLYWLIPFIIFQRCLADLNNLEFDSFKIRFFALAYVLITLTAAWANTALPYNPTSFFFMFWAAMGLKKNPNEVIS